MLDWLRKQAGKIFRGEQDGKMTRSVDRCLSELAQLRQELGRELTERTWSVDKIVIEKLQADKVELNLGSLDVGELSGMLSIGFNYGGRLIKVDSKGGGKTEQQPFEHLNQQKKPAARRGTAPADKGKVQKPGTCRPDADRQPGEPHPSAGAAARAHPNLAIRFK